MNSASISAASASLYTASAIAQRNEDWGMDCPLLLAMVVAIGFAIGFVLGAWILNR